MPAVNPLAIFAPGLNAVGAPWMTVGSIASNAYGEFRITLDVDVVVVMAPGHAERFAVAFPEEDFYCPPSAVIRTEVGRPAQGHFNLIDQRTMLKADIYIAASDVFQTWALRNRRQLTVDGLPVWLAPPEYVIVHKLEFFREGGSQKHLRDIRGMLLVTDVDQELLDREINARGLSEAWRAVSA